MQHHDPVKRLGDDRVWDIIFAGYGKAHVQKVGGIIEAVFRVNERLANRILIGHRCNGRQLGDHPDGGNFALPRITDVGAVMVERRHGPDNADHRGHWMGIAAEATKEIVHLFVHHGVVAHAAFKICKLCCIGQIAVQQQKANLKKAGLFSQLFDRVAAI